MSVAERQRSKSPGSSDDDLGGRRFASLVELSRDWWLRAGAVAFVAIALAYLWLGEDGGRWLTLYGGPGVFLLLATAASWRAAMMTRRHPEKRFWRLVGAAFSLWWVAVVLGTVSSDPTLALELLLDTAFAGFYTLLIVAVETRPHRRLEVATGPLEHRLMAPAVGFFVGGWLAYFSIVTAALELGDEESVLPSLLLFSLLDLYLTGRLAQLAMHAVGGWRRLYWWLSAAALGFLGADLFPVAEILLGFPWQWGSWFNVVWLLPLLLVVAAARLAAAGPRSSSPAPQGPIVRPLPTVLWALSFPALHAFFGATGWLAPAGRGTREAVVMVMLAILGAYAVLQRQFLVRHSLELWREHRRIEDELKESEQDLLLMVARGHQRIALERHEQTYQKAFSASPDALCLATWADGVIVDANRSYAEVLGVPQDNLIGRRTREFRVWRDPAVRRRVLDRVLAEGSVDFSEVEFRGVDGRRHRMALSFHRVETSEGRLLLSVSRRLDLLEPADSAAGDRRHPWALALEAAAAGVIAVDAAGAMVAASTSATDRFQLSPEAPWEQTLAESPGAKSGRRLHGDAGDLWLFPRHHD